MASAASPPGTCGGAARAPGPRSAPEGGEPELHLQMCKKIAQLTKVIYALNTKNDEHEASIQSLKEAHQEEIQHILAETKETVLHYKSKVEEEQELRQRIQALEEALRQRRQLNEEALTEFKTCRKLEGKREPQTESECTEEEILFHKELLQVKLDSENRVQALNQESDSLLNERGPFDGEILNTKGNLNEKRSMEMRALVSEMESLKRENQKLAEDYAKAASQLQASHERDREAWRKAMQQALADSCQEWQQREMEQRENFEAREVASQQQMKKLEADLEAKGQRVSELKKHSQKLREAMQDLERQLKEAQQATMESKSTMKTLEEELIIAKERLLMQENEIRQKTETIERTLNSQSKTRSEVGDLTKQILHFQQALSSKQSPGSKDAQEAQAQLEEFKKKHENEIRQLQREKDVLCGKLQDCSQEVLRLEDFIRQNRDIPRYAEFSKSLARKPFERQQESQDVSVQPKNVSKQHKERTKGREQLLAPTSTRNEEKRRSDSGSAAKREDEQTLASFLKEKAKEIQILQEEWSYQKAELQAQIAQLKQTLEQQASTFREALHEQNRQSGKEKEKLLQNLQDAIKQSQDTKVQMEASHQTAINLLEKSKNQELKEAEEHWKKESAETFKIQQESYRQEVQSLEEKAREALQSELEKMQQQQSLSIESLRAELSEQQVSCIAHKKEKEELQEELRNVMVLKRQQEGNNLDQIQSLKDELVKCQNEICGLKKENSLLKDTVDLLTEAAVQKQTSLQLEEEGQHRRFKESEETPRKREPWPEDLRLISCLQEKLSEKEEMIKELLDGRKLQPSLLPSTEPHRHRSFSFNTNPSTCLAPIAKKKKMDDVPSRIVSVPNLASYAKSFLSGDLRPKRNPPQITKSTSLDQNPSCVRVCYPPVQVLETKPGPRLQSNETAKPKEAQKQDSQRQEWFTKYFSF
ncbi:protein FAM184B isoform X2 [Eublepharis macularius]|uniref:Protein FAM184B isoform X2 n=1 Tax=Eublepharis macularius TaxID=481883 RepID=A0AA97KGW6_EUBMA|nr:protein FAM184B isoform X2 [Eublepharis macularius]